MKKLLLVANWKLNPVNDVQAVSLAKNIDSRLAGNTAEVVLCPPFPYLSQIKRELHAARLGAQDCFWEEQGAYTGEVSPKMLKQLGCSYVIIGHSERKTYLSETPEQMNKKMQAALAAKVRPIVCIGEKQQNGTKSKEEVAYQLRTAILGIKKPDVPKLVLAYEPEWAISTNKHATPATPEATAIAISYMREVLQKMLGRDAAATVPILYGGSVTSDNIAAFVQEGTAAGALVGSASLNWQEFVKLVNRAKAA